MQETVAKDFTLAFGLAVLIRVIVGLSPHSGEGTPPMFGDFEAQRHWLEVTINLPVGDWYRQTIDNDLQYWGLDYPPLTAYLSYVFGKIAATTHPSLAPLVTLHKSRGHESVIGRTFMRATVVFMDALILLPALVYLSKALFRQEESPTASQKQRHTLPLTQRRLLPLLVLPSILLIDHGHFQYNCVCIGLALWAAMQLHHGNELLACVLFCLSLNFKQMALYYAPVFFFAMLRKAVVEEGALADKIVHLAKLATAVLCSFALLWAPFCLYAATDSGENCATSLMHVLSRQFPFNRGIFEDKVSNLWYVASVVADPREYLSQAMLVRASLALTLALLAPTAASLLRNKLTLERLLLALINSALAFFLASFQVHEKSLLLALVPAALFAFLGGPDHLLMIWFQVFGCFTMFPLLRREGLALAYTGCISIYIGASLLNRNSVSFSSIKTAAGSGIVERLQQGFVFMSTLGAVALHAAELFIAPPRQFPHLHPALMSLYGAGNLLLFFGFTLYRQHCLVNK